MNVNTMYIPKSKKATEIAQVFGLKATDIRGHYISNIASTTPEQARQIAYILDPGRAASEDENAIKIAQDALDSPAAYGMTIEKAEELFNRATDGWWALGQ